jgi:hypothetical protein
MYYADLVNSINEYAENNFPTAVVNRFIEQSEQRIYNFVQLPSSRKNVVGRVSPANPYVPLPPDWLSTFSIASFTYTSGNITLTTGSNVATYSGMTPHVGQYVRAGGVNADTLVTSVGATSFQMSSNATYTGTVGAQLQGSYYYMLNKDVSFLREAFGFPISTGLPQYYALFGPQQGPNNPNPFDMVIQLAPTPDQIYNYELHYNAYPTSIIQASIFQFGTITQSGSFTDGTYYNQPLIGGSGTLATANIIVSTGKVTQVILANTGTGYVVGDVMTVELPYTTGTPTWSVPISVVSNPYGETWLGDNFDTALLNYCLMEAITYTKGEQDLVQLYQKRADDASALLKQLGDAKEKGDSYRDGTPKYKVV